MVKGSFQIRAKKESILTEKGVRVFIVEKLLNSAFSKGSVFNVDGKTIEVRLEGNGRQISEFIAELKKDLLAQFGNPIISFTEFNENQSLEIPELIRSSQALIVGQLNKGISVQLQILDTLSGMKKELLEVLPERIAAAIKEK